MMSDPQLLSEYDRLKKEIIERGRDTAKRYIPLLCEALQKDDPNLSRIDIRDRIRKDLVDVWSRSTIYENLPDEYKDIDKQQAARQSHKNNNINTDNKHLLLLEQSATESDHRSSNEKDDEGPTGVIAAETDSSDETIPINNSTKDMVNSYENQEIFHQLRTINAKLETLIKDISHASKSVERTKKEYEKESELLRAENKRLKENQLIGDFKVKAVVNQLWRELILLRNSNVTFCYREWIINIGGNTVNNNRSFAISIPFYVVLLGLAGGYLRYLSKAASKLYDPPPEQLKPETDSKDFAVGTEAELSEIALAPLLATVVWLLLSQGQTSGNIYWLSAVSFSVGLITKEIVDGIKRIMTRLNFSTTPKSST